MRTACDANTRASKGAGWRDADAPVRGRRCRRGGTSRTRRGARSGADAEESRGRDATAAAARCANAAAARRRALGIGEGRGAVTGRKATTTTVRTSAVVVLPSCHRAARRRIFVARSPNACARLTRRRARLSRALCRASPFGSRAPPRCARLRASRRARARAASPSSCLLRSPRPAWVADLLDDALSLLDRPRVRGSVRAVPRRRAPSGVFLPARPAVRPDVDPPLPRHIHPARDHPPRRLLVASTTDFFIRDRRSDRSGSAEPPPAAAAAALLPRLRRASAGLCLSVALGFAVERARDPSARSGRTSRRGVGPRRSVPPLGRPGPTRVRPIR